MNLERLVIESEGMIKDNITGQWAPLDCEFTVEKEPEGGSASFGTLRLYRKMAYARELIHESKQWVPHSVEENPWVLAQKAELTERVSNKRWAV